MDAYGYQRALDWATALGAPLLTQNGVQPPYTPAACRNANFNSSGILEDLWGITDAEGMRHLAERMWAGMHNPGFQDMRVKLSGMTLAQRKAYVESRREMERYAELYTVHLYMDRLPPAGIAAWDLGRLAFYLRCARLEGYIGEEEEEICLLHTAVRARYSYRSWPDYAVAYMAGRQFWAGDLSEELSEINVGILRGPLADESTPWRELEWEIELPEPPSLPWESMTGN
ncbi:DUF1266 domain-containing protein [Saccharibacillus sacchari]|uniref:DUF1266 domain-containing protein n=1 Tax=Saccharibacillus sacchari TaxID=456493 RepID=UPI0004B836D7|nr:DUF1266 domain-containing protein [Saccharibacillus sacchari]